MRRLLGPIAWLLVLASFALPFLAGPSAPPDPDGIPAATAAYTGFDLAYGGTADLLIPEWQLDGTFVLVEPSDQDMYGAPQPPLGGSTYGIVALTLIGLGLIAALLPVARHRAIVTASAALLASLAVLALEFGRRAEVAQQFAVLLLGAPISPPPQPGIVELAIGFWITMSLLLVIGFVHVALAVPDQRKAEAVTDSAQGTA